MGLFSSFAPASKFSRIGLLAAASALSAGGFFVCGGLAFAQSLAGPSVVGFWQSTFDDGNPSGWFYFTEINGVAEGRLVKMFKKAGETQLFVQFQNTATASSAVRLIDLSVETIQ